MDRNLRPSYCKDVSLPVLFLILTCALWGLSFPLVKALHLDQTARVPGTSSEFLAAWMQLARFSLGALMLLPFVGRQKFSRNEVRQGLVIALWGGLAMGMQADGLAYTPASTSAFLTQAYCVILPLWACLRSRSLPAGKLVVATLLVMIGGAVLSGIKPDDLRLGRGEIETLLASVLFAIQILTLENPKYEGNRTLPVTFIMCAGIAILFLPISALLAPNPAALLTAGASWPAALFVLVLALCCSVGAYLLMNHFQPKVSATEAGLIYTTEPVFTAGYCLFLPVLLGGLAGQAYPNEKVTMTLIVGGLLIVAANVLMQWRPSKS
ncbi:MAG: DMT family transporter [Verrucomicrobiales bacterium]